VADLFDPLLNEETFEQVESFAVANPTVRYGVVAFPVCAITDPRISFSDRGVLAFLLAQRHLLEKRQFLPRVSNVQKVNSLARLRDAGYFIVKFDRGAMTFHMQDVIAYEQGAKIQGVMVKEPKAKLVTPSRPDAKQTWKLYDPLDDEYRPTNITKELWKEYVKYRREERYSVKKAHVLRMKETIESYGENGAPSIKNAMANGYRGIFQVDKKGQRVLEDATNTQILKEQKQQLFEDEL